MLLRDPWKKDIGACQEVRPAVVKARKNTERQPHTRERPHARSQQRKLPHVLVDTRCQGIRRSRVVTVVDRTAGQVGAHQYDAIGHDFFELMDTDNAEISYK